MAVVWMDVVANEFLKGEDERDWGMFGEFAKQAPKTAAHFSKLNAEGYYLLSCLRGVKAKDVEKIAQETPFPENMIMATEAIVVEHADANADVADDSNEVEDKHEKEEEEKPAKKSSKKKAPESEPEPEPEPEDDDDDDFDFDFD